MVYVAIAYLDLEIKENRLKTSITRIIEATKASGHASSAILNYDNANFQEEQTKIQQCIATKSCSISSVSIPTNTSEHQVLRADYTDAEQKQTDYSVAKKIKTVKIRSDEMLLNGINFQNLNK
jgi:hypothetical protein